MRDHLKWLKSMKSFKSHKTISHLILNPICDYSQC